MLQGHDLELFFIDDDLCIVCISYILCVLYVNISIVPIRGSMVNTVPVGAVAPCIARSSAAMFMQDKLVNFFLEWWFKLSVTSLSWWMCSLQWRHNERDGVSNHRRPDCLLNRLHKHRLKNIKAPRHWPLWGEQPVTGGFPTQRASNAENVSIWWCHHVKLKCIFMFPQNDSRHKG